MAEPFRHIAVIDIGKTNAKVALVAAADGHEIALRTTANRVRQDGPYPHYDISALWAFVCDALAEMQREGAIDAISITAHGASGVLITGDPNGDGLALPALDYEFSGPDEFAAEYDAFRPAFSESLSARLPGGLNLGAQLFWQAKHFPEAFAAARFVTYPQYWAWRLTGVAATEVTSLGCHTDLWNPAGRDFSSLVDRLGWRGTMAPLRSAFDRLGPVKPELAQRLGLDPGTPVFCGIHDSNASLLPHLVARERPFTVISTGTWIIVLAVGGSTEKLDPLRDGLAYVNAYGDAVPGARFMGGREFDRLTGGVSVEPVVEDVDRVITQQIMALPSFAPGVGPFPDRQGTWSTPPEQLAPGERAAVASLYAALVTMECLEIVGAAGPIVVEGPFAANRIYCSALSTLAGIPVAPSGERTGTTLGAALLATGGASGHSTPSKQSDAEPTNLPHAEVPAAGGPRSTRKVFPAPSGGSFEAVPTASGRRVRMRVGGNAPPPPVEPLRHPGFPAYVAAWRNVIRRP